MLLEPPLALTRRAALQTLSGGTLDHLCPCLQTFPGIAMYCVLSLLLLLPTCAAAQAVHSSSEITPSRADVFLGYAYWHPLGGTIYQRSFTPIQPGVVLDASGYFGRYLGLQIEGGAFPNGDNDSIYTAESGPVVRYPVGRFSPFIHALGGGAKVGGPASQPTTWGWALTGGVGLDYIVPLFSNRLAVRPQADYQFSHTDFGPIGPNGLTGGLAEIRAYRLTGGLVYRFGASATPSRPLAYGCSAEPSMIFPGELVTITGSSISSRQTNARHLIYSWATTGGHLLSGEGNGAPANEDASIATSGLAPGDYLVTGHLIEGKRTSQRATCTTSFTVQNPPPPSLACSATPVAIVPGGQTVINAYGSSPQNRPLRYTYSTPAGQIIPYASTVPMQQNQAAHGPMAMPSNRVVLDTSGVPSGTVNVSCTVTDDLNQTTNATAIVQVNPPLTPPVSAVRLCTLSFERDRRRPGRVNNEGKACLDEVALSLNRDPGAKLTITGEFAPRETHAMAQLRAVNARAYLVDEKGIDSARITLRVGNSEDRTARLTLFPFGAPPDLTGIDGAPSSINPSAYDRGQPQGSAGAESIVPAASYHPSPGTLTTPDSLVLPPLKSDNSVSSRTHHRTHTTARSRRKGTTNGTGSDASSSAIGSADTSRTTPSSTSRQVPRRTTHHPSHSPVSTTPAPGTTLSPGSTPPNPASNTVPMAQPTTAPTSTPTAPPSTPPQSNR